jgi:hypothetical protein
MKTRWKMFDPVHYHPVHYHPVVIVHDSEFVLSKGLLGAVIDIYCTSWSTTASYVSGPGFKLLPGDRLSGLRVFVVFLIWKFSWFLQFLLPDAVIGSQWATSLRFLSFPVPCILTILLFALYY